ncbi:MAG: hypothetical protein F4X92_00105 [Gammaproteobacteria bacterium]|nr:hypothetical protein [Gammaproteobacteria bacterium]
MTGHLLLDFPVLQPDAGDFSPDIQYTVEAMNFNGTRLKIDHHLSGKSFISKLLKSRHAKFSVQLFYQECSERQTYTCCGEVDGETGGINATQDIPLGFSYLPVIKPSIVVIKDTKLVLNENSGLTDFWEVNTEFEIPAYSRVAHHAKLTFSSGDISSLIQIKVNEEMKPGTMSINVSESAKEGESPVALTCSPDVFDELKLITLSPPQNNREAMRSGMVTQALCAVYAYMHKRQSKDSCDGEEHRDISSILQAHHDELYTKTDMSWNDENFDPSLAATRMHPYSIQSLHSG